MLKSMRDNVKVEWMATTGNELTPRDMLQSQNRGLGTRAHGSYFQWPSIKMVDDRTNAQVNESASQISEPLCNTAQWGQVGFIAPRIFPGIIFFKSGSCTLSFEKLVQRGFEIDMSLLTFALA